MKKAGIMMEKLTSLQRENLYYRKRRMTSKTCGLDLLVSGRGESLPPRMRTPKGRYSESRTQSLKRQITDGIELGGLDREFFDSFLYCVLRLAERGPALLRGPGFEWSVDGTFQDLLALADTVDPWGDRYDRWYQSFFGGGSSASFSLSFGFSLLDSLYERFSGEPVERALSRLLPEVQEKAAARYGLEQGSTPEPEYTPRPEEWDGEYIPDGLGEREWETLEQEWEELEREEELAWEKDFPEKARFCQTYLLCRKRYFETEHCRGLAVKMEQAVDEYLCRAGISGYLKDDAFFTAYGLLERSEKQLSALLKEVR